MMKMKKSKNPVGAPFKYKNRLGIFAYCEIHQCNKQARLKNKCKNHYYKEKEEKYKKSILKAKRKYRVKNKEKLKIYQKSTIRKIQAKNWRESNKEKCKKASKKFYQSNKAYSRAKAAKRRAAKLKRTPKWANLQAIQVIYANCPPGYHVDHIVPLRGHNVSGLHVEYNLQYLPASQNMSKGNRMPQ